MADLKDLPTLNPTRSTDGSRSSVLIEVRGHVFQASYVCLPTGELSDPVIHGTRADVMTPEERIELENEARVEAMRIKEEHRVELLAGMSVVKLNDLLLCVAGAPKTCAEGQVHRLQHWDPITGADEVPDPPRSHPILTAVPWNGAFRWLFWGTLDVELDPHATPDAVQALSQRLAAEHVEVRSTWRSRPELLAVF